MTRSPTVPDHAVCLRALAPGDARSDRAGRALAAASGAVELRLPYRPPLWPDSLFGHLAATALPGIGPWTPETVLMRALGDPDALLPTDLGVVAAAAALGLPAGRGLVQHAERWRPWRAYAVQHLWGTSPHPVDQLPSEDP